MIIVDKREFSAWTQGVLLDRTADGAILVADRAIHDEAMDALEAGETIGLTVAGRLVGTLRLGGEQYVEAPL